MGVFEVFEHTADVGLRVQAASLAELFVEAARGAFALVIENPDAIEPRQAIAIDLAAEDLEGLFVDWLRELIYRFETEHLLLCEFHLQLADENRRLHAECRGEPADWSRHLPDNELKAVTYHGLRVEQTARGWEAEVIFDI
jgi:SHS2 domain-containing protein